MVQMFLHLQRQVIIPCISRHPHRITRTRPGSFTVTIGEQKSNETVVPTEPTEPTAPSEPDDTSKPTEPSKPDDNKDNPDTGADNPQTGDNSNLALWFVLLFAAAGGLTATTIVIRKRKAE